MQTIKLKIVSHTGVVFSEECVYVSLPTETGIIGILPNHEKLVTKLKEGSITVRFEDNKEQQILISGGVLSIENNDITIIADSSHLPQNIMLEEVEKALKEAEEKFGNTTDPAELIQLEKQIRYQKLLKKQMGM